MPGEIEEIGGPETWEGKKLREKYVKYSFIWVCVKTYLSIKI